MRPPSSDESEPPPPHDITQLLLKWNGSGDASDDELLSAVYAELHRQAARAMRREGADHTLQATALVHEAYLRLVDQRRVEWRNRAHFFGIAAQMMRRILVDHARGRDAAKRGGGAASVTLTDAYAVAEGATADAIDVLALHDALDRLAALDSDQARIVTLRYFGGMNIEETAEAMGVSPATVKREWAVARAWLRRELGGT
ncbi:MAG TPA: sigma-70 family RNA polymerase sigma factor [Gemmatimonadaceae bacterium]|jgi:RNA polymerase sigma factor (TIGR02999 family)|nr:sigma-70 family RNA polymerase sigma factor [Gemmatimonadaceae bacterium]